MTTSEEQIKELENLHIIVNELHKEIKVLKSKVYKVKTSKEVPEYKSEYEDFFSTLIEFFIISFY